MLSLYEFHILQSEITLLNSKESIHEDMALLY